MTEDFCVTLIYLLPHVLVGVVRISVTAPVELLSNLFPQRGGACQMSCKIEFSTDTDSLQPEARCFIVADAGLLEPRMGRLVYYSACDPFDRYGFAEDDTLIQQAGVQGVEIAASSMGNQAHPDSCEAVLDAPIVKWSTAFDQPKRSFNTLNGWLGVRSGASEPKTIDDAACRKPEFHLLNE